MRFKDLLSSFTLKTVIVKGASKPLGFSGFAVRGVLYELLKSIDPMLSEELHGLKRLAPISTTPLTFEYRSGGGLKEGSIVSFRITSLLELLSVKLADYLINNPSLSMNIKDAVARLTEVAVSTIEPKKLLENATPVEFFAVQFRSPTFFRRSMVTRCCPSCPVPRPKCLRLRRPRRYRYVPFPDPYLMLRSLLRLWRKFTGVTLNYKEYVEWLLDGGVVASGYPALKTVRVYEHPTTPKWSVGFKGIVYFNLPEDTFDDKMARITDALLRFGEYSNVGANRTAGFGVIRYQPKKQQESRKAYT